MAAAVVEVEGKGREEVGAKEGALLLLLTECPRAPELVGLWRAGLPVTGRWRGARGRKRVKQRLP